MSLASIYFRKWISTYQVLFLKCTLGVLFISIDNHSYAYIAEVTQYIHIGEAISSPFLFCQVPDMVFIVLLQCLRRFTQHFTECLVLKYLSYAKFTFWWTVLNERYTVAHSCVLKNLCTAQVCDFQQSMLLHNHLTEFFAVLLVCYTRIGH